MFRQQLNYRFKKIIRNSHRALKLHNVKSGFSLYPWDIVRCENEDKIAIVIAPLTAAEHRNTARETISTLMTCNMALLTFLFLSLSTEHVFLCVTCPCTFLGLNATLIFSLVIIIIIIMSTVLLTLKSTPKSKCRKSSKLHYYVN